MRLATLFKFTSASIILILTLAVTALFALIVTGCQALVGSPESQLGGDMPNRLVIPPVLEPTSASGDRKRFDLTLQSGRTRLPDGETVQTWGANGNYLGPTLMLDSGDKVTVRTLNQLPEPTTIHWHGMALDGLADGGPHRIIRSGAALPASWTVEQPASTLWYHPHPHNKTTEHVNQGIAGLVIVQDEKSRSLPLPRKYGVDDIPLIIQDRKINNRGEFELSRPFGNIVGPLGDRIHVNGTPTPFHEVEDDLVRLRLLNGSVARTYRLHFDDNREFNLIGSDSGLLRNPHRLNSLQLSPGERAEIVVSVKSDETFRLRSSGVELGMGFPMDRLNGASDQFDIVEFRAQSSLRSNSSVPTELIPREALDPSKAVKSRQFELDSFSRINGREMNMNRVDAKIGLGDKEIWEIRNRSSTFHNFHIHMVHFEVLDIDGKKPPPELQGLKDTVAILPNQTVRLIMKFTHPATTSAPFMFHCHLLAHEDAGMMGQFTVQ